MAYLLDLLLDDSGGWAEAEQEDFLDEDEGSILLLGAAIKICQMEKLNFVT